MNGGATLSPGSSGSHVRTRLSVEELKQALRDNLICGMAPPEAIATKHDIYVALALTVRDRLYQRAIGDGGKYSSREVRCVAYLSAEFLPGPHLANNLLSLGILETACEALQGMSLQTARSAITASASGKCSQGCRIAEFNLSARARGLRRPYSPHKSFETRLPSL